MNTVGNIFGLLAISQLLTVVTYFLLHHRNLLGRLIAALGVCLIAYVVGDLTATLGNATTTYLLFRVANLLPVLLVVIAHLMFNDEHRIGLSVWVLAALSFGLRSAGVPFYDPAMDNSTFWFIVIYVIPQTILLYLSILAVVIAARGYRYDLLEERRNFRVVFVISMGILVAMRTANAYFSFADPFLDSFWLFAQDPLPLYLFSSYTFFLALGFNVLILRLQPQAMALITLPTTATPAALPTVAIPIRKVNPNQKSIDRIRDLMQSQRLYATTGFTISDLARAVGMQEYRLRKLVNKEMGYRNFNQILNHYRIEEASRRLLESDIPISSIALDVGYASLSTFNTVFKARFGMTPSEYRGQHTGDGSPPASAARG